ncbi:MAG: 4Fe-4S dicluster domain-containing protein [Dehalococcoidales bacterium]|nr:4Fe-4S dicluster domain-containing protein [Dehalococcoidales bacterium]
MKTKFIDEVKATPGGEKVLSCIQCGMCSGSCPMASRMEYAPRQLIAMIRADMKEEVLSSNSMWYCLSCYLCTARCPKDVKPTDLAHALESLATQQGYRTKGNNNPAMYRAFVDSIRSNGRVHEFGLMLKYYMSTNPFAALKVAPVGLQMFLRKRLPLMPTRVKNQGDIPAIIKKFKEVRSK